MEQVMAITAKVLVLQKLVDKCLVFVETIQYSNQTHIGGRYGSFSS